MERLSGERFSDLRSRVAGGQVSSQEKIDFTTKSAQLHDSESLPLIEDLLEDTDPLVRYFALQAVVIDYNIVSPMNADRCWGYLERDPDEDVRRMAARCLGKILFNSRNLGAFRKLRDFLMGGDVLYVKSGVYIALFEIAGKTPQEWPSVLLEGKGIFEEGDIDWGLVAELERQLEG